MKALTISQPRASLVAGGAIRVDTRSWGTDHRGWMAIHAGRLLTYEGMMMCSREPFRGALAEVGIMRASELQLGVVVAVCRLVNCFKIQRGTGLPEGLELVSGDYTVGRYMWLFMDILRLPEPVRARGARMLWDWRAPDEVRELIYWRGC